MNEEKMDEVVYLYLDDIIPNRFQPREVFDENALKELAVSIKEHGVIQPIIVRSVNGKYEIIAGERRYKASALAGMTKIPAIVRNLDDKESSKVALLENLQRKNLTPIEEARTYQKILEIDEMTQEELAKTMGKSQSSVANKLRLLSLPDEVQDALLKEQISERHARALLNIPNHEKQVEMLKNIMNNKLSVRVVEQEIKKLYSEEEDNNMNNGFGNDAFVNIPSSNTFINNEPLAPTRTFEEQQSEYGKIKFVPPVGESDNFSQPINYGEIGKEEYTPKPMVQFNDPTTPNVSNLREQAVDINPINKNSGTSADLDSLLNIQNMSLGPAMGNIPEATDNFSATNAINNPIQQATGTADYFSSAPIIPGMANNIDVRDKIEVPRDITKESSVNKIKELAAKLKEFGIPLAISEMDFPTSYQIIIKIDK